MIFSGDLIVRRIMGFIVALKYNRNTVDLSGEFKTIDPKVARIKGALFDEPIPKKTLLFTEGYQN